ncbi:hypothetical protein CDAR_60401 [Caerostris darwini]|uniref:Uncharacterized protein n=1 Tax=Caerostris darwini TaxID=1538125 RepID=A0AAV4QI82_9ARAC|nr:hypothetical protein CDAR_60401 [Caerostris darwini]
MQKTYACRRQEELNWRNALYVRIVIFAHKTTISEGGCKRWLQLRQLSSEYKFRGEEEERLGYKCSTLGEPRPPPESYIGEILNISFFQDLLAGELKFYFDAEEKVNCA